jgi:nitroimidazol reductase NimA-like FMN-containing flavoprotein (pyridoxamine 5'-phosphate oxidase superfamily)
MSIVRATSAWDRATIEDFLRTVVIPVRLACVDTAGAPLICSLWDLYADGAIWCATQQSASVVALLGQEPRCAFEVAPETMPYRGVRGQGHATVLHAGEGEAVLRRLLERYVGSCETGLARWLLKRAATEVAIRVEPEWLNSWDFSDRMRDGR